MNTYFAALAVAMAVLTGFAGEAVAAPQAHRAAAPSKTAPKPVARVTPRPAPVKLAPKPVFRPAAQAQVRGKTAPARTGVRPAPAPVRAQARPAPVVKALARAPAPVASARG
ncbi:MAG TPA: hypothetical protein PKX01_16395, partial [Rhodocyclaceae bacterium]|nr:hypothetical protein [Rhodocyclaceae bacterium]